MADHSLQYPSQLHRTQCDLWWGVLEGVDVGAGDGSTHIKPKKAEEVQEWLVLVKVVVGDGSAGGDVMVWESVLVAVSSLHPQNRPGVLQSVGVGEVAACEVVVGSLHPNQPGVSQVVVSFGVLVAVWAEELLDTVVVVVSSLHPNQPGYVRVSLCCR